MAPKTLRTLFILVAWVAPFSVPGQPTAPYKNSSLSVNQRVNDLLPRMTPEEKFWQLFMIPGDLSDGAEKYKNGIFGLQVRSSVPEDAAGQFVTAANRNDALETARKINAIQKYFVEQTRLGIPIIPFEEALHGLVAPGATSFPAPIALAATWNTGRMAEVANAIAQETKSRGYRDILSPVVNLAMDPRWGRTEETYGEDPFLTSEMGVAFVSAFEKLGVITTPKHFLANSGDGGRDSYPIEYNERILEEIYLTPFRACIERGGSRSLMTSYNSINGSPSSANDWLLNRKLKGDMKFRGFTISDAGAVGGANVLHYTAGDYEAATVHAMMNGADVIFQTAYDHHRLFIPPFLDGRINKKVIDSAVARVLRVKFELGLFDHPYVDEKAALSANQKKENATIARTAARESIVLLKNDNQTMPLNKLIRKLAVIGTDAEEGRLGGYSRPGSAAVSILDALKQKLGSTTSITYAPGCGRKTTEFVPIPSTALSASNDGVIQHGLHGEYFNNIDLTGKPTLQRHDKDLNFHWTLYSPDPSIHFDFFSVRWTGKLKAPVSGKYRIGLEGNDGYRLFLDNKLIIDNWKSQTASSRYAEVSFEKDRTYDLRIEFFESSGISTLRLVWNVGIKENWKQQIDEAVTAASRAEACIIVVGIEEGEGQDRAHLNLPGHQEEMITRISAIGKPVIVVLIGGSAVTMSRWLDKVPAVMDAWYPGDQGGHAVADVLFGDYNPAGRLPISFPVFEGQLPYTYNHKPTGRNDDYADLSGQPLFPFGFGLSYSTFQYSGLRFDKDQLLANESTTVRFQVKNTGTFDGDEVVQLYIRDELSSVAQPVKQLKGFQRVFLKAGEQKEVSFAITPDQLKMLNGDMKWVVEPGTFRVMIGASSRDIRLRGILTVKE